MKTQNLLAGAMLAVLSSMSAMAAPPGKPGATAGIKTQGASLSPAERGELARQFVLKWGDYVQRVHGLDARTWSQRMVGTFTEADSTNFRQALKRSTYEGAIATLDGKGHRLGDAKVVDTLAKSSSGEIGPYALGELTQDLVFTPLEPCRIVDTRSMASGAIAAGTNRGFYAWGFASFTSQGGSATNCGLSSQSPEAIVVNVTAVAPAQTGYATLYPASGTAPLAASMIYEAGKTLSNGAVVKLGTSGSVDFRIFSERAVHYVVDIVGYYDAPYATALQCTNTYVTQTVAANATFDVPIPACPTGYTETGAGCRTPGFNDVSWAINGLFPQGPTQMDAYCAGTNLRSTTVEVRGGSQCCRVPGR